MRIPALEEEVRNPQFLNDDLIASESREESSATDKAFKLTRDEGQFNALTEIARLACLNTEVVHYEDLTRHDER